MEGQGAEGAGAEAAPVGNQTEPDLLNGGDTPRFFVAGMVIPAVGQVVGPVHLLLGQWLLGRILDHIFPRAIGFGQTPGGEGVRIAVLNLKALGVPPGVFLQLPVVRQDYGGQAVIYGFRPVNGAVHIGDIRNMEAAVEAVGHLPDAPLSHTVEQQVGLGIQQKGASHLIGPVIIVGKPAQTGLHTAYDDGYIPVGLADQIAVHDGCPIRAFAHDTAGGKGIALSPVVGYRIVIHHGIHIAAGHKEAQPGLAQGGNGFGVFPVGLGQDAHLISRRL